MNPFADPRPNLVALLDDHLSEDTAERKAKLAKMAGVSETEVDCWLAGKSRPDGVQLRYVMNLLRSPCAC